jgi:cysteine desulfurase
MERRAMEYTYLDYGATTPVDDRVLSAMRPYFDTQFGNPSSIHNFGQQAETALENARRNMASHLGAKYSELIFTSSGSESDNLALRGAAFAARKKSKANHLLISPIEHPAVLLTAKQLEQIHGFKIKYLPVDEHGMVSPDSVKANLHDRIAIVSVMHANNEIGTLNPIQEIGEICREFGVPFHTDAVQSGAHFPLNVNELQVDLLSLGAHKFYGPKGVGALYVRSGIELVPMLTGGSQERKLRASTQNIPLIVGMATAFDIVQQESKTHQKHFDILRKHLINHVIKEVPNSRLTGHPDKRLPNHASFVFEGVDGNLLISLLNSAGFACSSGSACKTGNPEPSVVLTKLGYPPSWALGSLRVTLGKESTREEIDAFLRVLPECIKKA